MKKQLLGSALLIFSIACSFSGCGKRPKNFFSFEEKVEEPECPRFAFPAVKHISCQTINGCYHLSWNAIEHPELIGYNVYRFSPSSFIPKRPRNTQPIVETEFLDIQSPTTYVPCYVVRGLFTKDGKKVEGPTSAIVVCTT